MTDKFRRLNNIIENEKAFENFRKAVKQQDIISKFHEVFPNLNNIAIPVKLLNGVLTIRVENSVWRSELNLKKKTMIDKINGFFEEEIVKNIRFI